VLIGLLLAGGWAIGSGTGERRAGGILAIAGTILVALLGIVLTQQRAIGMRLAAIAIEKRVGYQAMNELPDGLHVGLCGSGSPLPDANRAGPCVFVIAGRHLYIVDAGEGSPRKLALMGLGPPLIDTIFLTHFHSDHIGGLGEMMLQRWAGSGSTTPVDVIGPQGVEMVVDGLNHAYQLDTGYRVAHHGAEFMPPTGTGGHPVPFTVAAGVDWSQVVFERDGLKVTAFNVIHLPVFPAVGYRFDYGGRSVVVSGDTAPSQWLVKNAQGVDVLFHEALQTSLVSLLHDRAVQQGNRNVAKITADIPSYHTTPEDAARLATQAGVRHLVLYHTIPPLPSALFYPAFLGDAPSLYRGPLTVGEDGLLVSLPKGSHEVGLRKLL